MELKSGTGPLNFNLNQPSVQHVSAVVIRRGERARGAEGAANPEQGRFAVQRGFPGDCPTISKQSRGWISSLALRAQRVSGEGGGAWLHVRKKCRLESEKKKTFVDSEFGLRTRRVDGGRTSSTPTLRSQSVSVEPQRSALGRTTSPPSAPALEFTSSWPRSDMFKENQTLHPDAI